MELLYMELCTMVILLFLYLSGTSAVVVNEKVCKTEDSDYVNYSNIEKLVGCTTIQGNIEIVQATFDGDRFLNVPGIHPGLLNGLQSVREVTGVVIIQGIHKDFKSLSFLKNLTTVYGRGAEGFQRLSFSVAFTTLESLDLSSLRSIRSGNVAVVKNEYLCYADKTTFERLIRKKSQRIVVKKNRSKEECGRSGHVCASVCSSSGCWGPGRENCVGNITENNLIDDTVRNLNVMDLN